MKAAFSPTSALIPAHATIIADNKTPCSESLEVSHLKPEQLQPSQADDAGISTSSIHMNIGAGSPLLSGIGKVVTTINDSIPRDGGPLSNLLGPNVLEPETISHPTTEVQSNLQLPVPPTKPDRNLLTFAKKDPEVNIDIINQNVVTQNEEIEEKDFEQPRSGLPGFKNPPRDSGLGIDWDADDLWEHRFIRYVMDDKKQRLQQILLLEQRGRELQEKEQQIAEMKQLIDQRQNELKAREAKIAEIEPLIPSIKQLQGMGITFELIFPYIETINEKSALENIDLKTAAYNMMRDFREYRNLGLRRVIENAEKQLTALGPLIREKQAAISALIKLRIMGFTQYDIAKLMGLMGTPGNGYGYRKLDTELIDVGTQMGNNGNDNLQQPGSNNPGSTPLLVNDNGSNGFSKNNFIRLNLLRNATTNMLNRMGTKN